MSAIRSILTRPPTGYEPSRTTAKETLGQPAPKPPTKMPGHLQMVAQVAALGLLVQLQ